MRNSSVWGRVSVWLPVVVACLVIVAESTDTFSADHTGGWLRPVLERVFGPLRDETAGEINHYLRKTGHFCGYGTVCLTFLRAWLLTFGALTDLGRRAWRWRAVIAAVACTAFVASMDEWHQSYIPSRTGTVHDALLDTTGAAVSCGLVWLFFWRKQRRGRSLR
ncbi:VanZ family protein [Granulicella tundricola MP5ACTX9]|uniref:VanZ family protein n=2 Tax=Granulicella TaxID=940557 RepID=E8WZ16_GRATM|nr:VanZ family protein [Granulicella tundricola MP5ACTX9]